MKSIPDHLPSGISGTMNIWQDPENEKVQDCKIYCWQFTRCKDVLLSMGWRSKQTSSLLGKHSIECNQCSFRVQTCRWRTLPNLLWKPRPNFCSSLWLPASPGGSFLLQPLCLLLVFFLAKVVLFYRFPFHWRVGFLAEYLHLCSRRSEKPVPPHPSLLGVTRAALQPPG